MLVCQSTSVPNTSNATTSMSTAPPRPVRLPGVVLRGGFEPGEDVVKLLEGVLAQRQGDRVQRVVQLLHGPRPDDRRRHTVLVQQPGQRHVGRLFTELVAQVLVG